MTKQITFVSSNRSKWEEVEKILKPQDLGLFEELVFKSLEYKPHLQAETTRDLAINKCEEAFKIIQGPVIVEVSGLHFQAMGDLPGVHTKSFMENLKPIGLLRSLIGFNNFAAEASCTVALKEAGNRNVLIFEGIYPGSIVQPCGGSGWDCIFQPDGFTQTFAEMPKNLKNNNSQRYRALSMLKEYLKRKEPIDDV